MKKVIGFLLILVHSIPLCIFSNEPASTDPDSLTIKYRFNPVVKTASKMAHTQRDLAAAISIIDNETLRRTGIHTVLNAVQRHVPGIYLTEWGVMGFGVAGSSAGKISMRGLGGTADTHVLILRNGRPDFMGLMGCTIADEFVADNVKRIEVVRGPASFLYGSNASAGVINIITDEIQSDGFQTELKAGFGAYGSEDLSASHGGKTGPVDYRLSISQRQTDGHRQDGNNQYQGRFYTLHTGVRTGRNASVEINASYADINLFDPGPLSSPKDNDWYDIRRWGGDFTWNQKSRLGDSYLKIHGNFGRHRFADGWRSFDRMAGMMLYHNMILFHGNTLTLGADWKEYGGHGENVMPGADGQASIPRQDHLIREYAPYMHIQQLLFKRLIVSSGLRIEYHSLYGNVTIPKAGMVFHLQKSAQLRLVLSKGFRSPSLRELYFFPTCNQSLQPDEFWNAETGFLYNITRTLQLDFSLYQIRGSNLITLARRASGPGYQLINAGKTENTGYELNFQWMPVSGLDIGAAWSYMHMKYPVPNAPAKKLMLNGEYRKGKLVISGDLTGIWDWTGRDTAVPIPHVYPMQNYTLINMSVSYSVIHSVPVTISVNNVLNTEYESMYGYPMPGRTVSANIVFGF